MIANIVNFINEVLCLTGNNPKHIPVTKHEFREAINSVSVVGYSSLKPEQLKKPEIFGIPIHETPYGRLAREKIIDNPFVVIEETNEVNLLEVTKMEDNDGYFQRLKLALEAKVMANTTELEVKVNCDPLESIKLKFKWLERWFPIKTQTVKISGLVLYPYLNIDFPANRHSVQFFVK